MKNNELLTSPSIRIRIEKIIIENFKGIRHGEIVLNPFKETNPYGVSADILGLYGQNGSGKSACIDALYILKVLMSGKAIEDPFICDSIGKAPNYSKFEFVFIMKTNEYNGFMKAIYSFCISEQTANEVDPTIEKMAESVDLVFDNLVNERVTFLNRDNFKRRACVYNEVISFSGVVDEKVYKLQKYIDTSTKNTPFGPVSKHILFLGNPSKDDMISLEVNKRLAKEKSCSFIFSQQTLEHFNDLSGNKISIFLYWLNQLHYYANDQFEVVQTQHMTGDPRNSVLLVMHTISTKLQNTYPMNTVGGILLDDEDFSAIHEELEKISDVLEQIIPSLRVELREIAITTTQDGTQSKYADIIVHRNGLELPLRSESDGIRKILSILGLYIASYNDPSTTVVIDELDSGVFEYLLGELLQIFQEHGKGQLIFTSHNLRPLEVLNKEYLCFTTTNPDNSYIRLKHIGASNNLRNTYFREILLDEQDEELYKATKAYKIVSALRKVGAK